MSDMNASTTYFEFAGEVNTDRLLAEAIARTRELGIRHLVVASETGRSALKAMSVLRRSGIDLIVVTHYPSTTWGPCGDIPIGLGCQEHAERRRRLQASGATIVQGTRPFAPPSRAIGWDYPTPEAVVDKALGLFGAGVRIAVEAVLIATDGGHLLPGEDVVSCAGTFKGLDTAIVARAAHSDGLFRDLDVLEIVAKPRMRVKTLPEYNSPVWRGDLSQYYCTKDLRAYDQEC